MSFSFEGVCAQPVTAPAATTGGFSFQDVPLFEPNSSSFSFGTSNPFSFAPVAYSRHHRCRTVVSICRSEQGCSNETIQRVLPLEHIVYNDELFISKPDRMYECSICLNTLRNATICTSCGNSFCHKCIVDCITRLHKCSVCGCKLKSTTEGIVPNRTTRGVIENYEVKCFSTQKSHQSGVGAFYGTFAVGLPHNNGKTNSGVPPLPPAPPTISSAPDGKSLPTSPPIISMAEADTPLSSSSSLPSSSLPAVSSSLPSSPLPAASSSLPSSSLPAEMCTEMCNWTGLLRDAESHYRLDCHFALVHCTFEGCSYISPRKDAYAHLSQCPFRRSSCRWCKKGPCFFRLHIVHVSTHIFTYHVHDYTRTPLLIDYRNLDLSSCRYTTSTEFVFHLVSSHESLLCDQRMVECPNGCCNELSGDPSSIYLFILVLPNLLTF